jgi:CRISPR-associated protein Csa1
MFFTFEDVIRISRIFRRKPCEISEELRGWHWDEYPLTPSYSIRINVSDIAGGFCPTNRYVYMKYVLRHKEKTNFRLELGSFIHKVYHMIICKVKSILYEGINSGTNFKEVFNKSSEEIFSKVYSNFQFLKVNYAKSIFEILWNQSSNIYAAALDRLKSISPYLSLDGLINLVIPIIAEFPIDGTLIGLNRAIRIDAMLYPHIIVELKTRSFKPEYEIGLAAYALAIESQYEIPINYAVLLEIKLDEKLQNFNFYEKYVLISDEIRERFIERRDAIMRIIEEKIDPGKPEKCPEDCPFLEVCSDE